MGAAAVHATASDPAVAQRLAALGVVAKPMTTPEFGTFVADETAKWAKVIKFADLKVD